MSQEAARKQEPAAGLNILDQEACEWLIKLQSEAVCSETVEAFDRWLQTSSLHQVAYVRAEQAWQEGMLVSHAHRLVNKPVVRLAFVVELFTRQAPWVASFAVLILVVMVVFVEAPELQPEVFITHGNTQTFALADGSKVTLARGSRVEFIQASLYRRLELTRGRIYLDVVRMPSKAFYVVSESGAVKVTGTEFAVKKQGNNLLVTVTEGEVALMETYDPATALSEPKPLVTLKVNQQSDIATLDAGGKPQNINADLATAWRDGQMIIENIRMDEVIQAVNSNLNSQITLASPTLAEREIAGVIRLDHPAKVAHALAALVGGEAVIQDGSAHIKIVEK